MEAEHADVIVVGAGLAGVGAACRIRRAMPGKSLVILEAADDIGGTWNLFKYPGIRSDSDMQTLGYSFRPWRSSKALAGGAEILDYVRQTAEEYDLGRLIRPGHRLIRAAWSTEHARWQLEVELVNSGERSTLTCGFLHLCTGYYDAEHGHLPRFEGAESFTGSIVHPQHWPADLDHADKRIVVIGSGATAATLLPELAKTASHVTMLQRSPSYVVSRPSDDAVARYAMRRLPKTLADNVIRWKNVALLTGAYRAARYAPRLTAAAIRAGVRSQLGDQVDVDTHFAPRYEPWEQRVCFVPDGDFFAALRTPRASVVTGEIARFTPTGIELRDGQSISCDVIVTATGLNLKLLGGATLTVDDRAVSMPQCVVYKGMMLSGVPNMAFAMGYSNASWTLKCDLVAGYVCRLLHHMDVHGFDAAVPRLPEAAAPLTSFVDLTSGYVERSRHLLPSQTARLPWRFHGNYFRDRGLYRRSRVDDDMELTRRVIEPVLDGSVAAILAAPRG